MPPYQDIDALLRGAKDALSRADKLSASIPRAEAPVAPRKPAPVAAPEDDSLWGKVKKVAGYSPIESDIGSQFANSVDRVEDRDSKALRGEYGAADKLKSFLAGAGGGFFDTLRSTATPAGLATLGNPVSKVGRAASAAGSAIFAGQGAETLMDENASGGEKGFGAAQTAMGLAGLVGAAGARPTPTPQKPTGAGAKGPFSALGPDTSTTPTIMPEAPPIDMPIVADAPSPAPSPRFAPFADLPEAPAPKANPLGDWMAKYANSGTEAAPTPPEMATRHSISAGRLPEGVESTPASSPIAKFLAHQEDGDGGGFPLYNVEGGPSHGSTVSAETLAEMGIAVPETPAFAPKPRIAASEFANILKGREKFAAQNPDAQLPPGGRDELDRLGLEYSRTQAELKTLLGMPDADPREVERMKQGARELGSRLRRGAKAASAPPTEPTPEAPTSLASVLQASLDEQEAAKAAKLAAQPPPAPGRDGHFKLPETHRSDDAYTKIRDGKGIAPSPLERATRDVGGGTPPETSGADRFTAEYPFGPNSEAGAIDPRLLASLLKPMIGAGAGAAFDDENPMRGAAMGGVLGAGTMIPGVADKAVRLRLAAMLAGPAQAKSLVGSVGVAGHTAAERALTHGPAAGGKVLKEFFSPQTLRDAKSTFKGETVPLERMDLPTSTDDKGIIGTPFRAMGAADEATKNALARAGVDDGANRNFTGEPGTKFGKALLALKRDGGNLSNLFFPFVKTAINQAEAGVTPFTNLAKLGEMDPAAAKQAKVKALLAAGYAGAGAAYGTTDFAEDHPALAPWAAVAAGPGAVPFAAAQQFTRALTKGKNRNQALAAGAGAMQDALPMPSEWAGDPRQVLASLVPTGLREINTAAFDSTPRDTNGSLFGPMLSRIPFLSRTLKPKSSGTRRKHRNDD